MTSLLPDQIIDEAQSVCSDYAVPYPTTKSVMFLRVNQCQKELFARAAEVDQEYYGLQADLTLDASGCADLSGISETAAFPMERIDDVRIHVANEPELIGTRVNIVPAYDAEAHLAPRATIRSHVIAGFSEDLAGVGKLRIYYTRRPRTIGRDGLVAGAELQVPVELESPWDYLLVWDLILDLIRRTDAADKDRKEKLGMLVKESFDRLLADYLAHVAGFVHMRQDRH